MVRRDANAERGKYTKVGDPKQTRSTSEVGSIRKCLNRCMVCCISTLVMLCILAIVGFSSPEYNNDNLRSGQASEHGVTASQISSRVNNDDDIVVAGRLDDYQDDEYKITEVDVNDAVEEVGLNIKIAAQNELEKEEDSILKSAVIVFGQYVRIGISKMFAELTAEEIEEIAEEIEEDVLNKEKEEYKEIADEIVQDEMVYMENMVDAEEEQGNDMMDVELDVFDSEIKAVEDVKIEIDNAAVEVAETMRENSAAIEKEVLEKSLSKKLGKKVTLVIEDNEIDDMLADLPNLKAQNDPNQEITIPLASVVGQKLDIAPPPLPPNPPPP